MSLSTASKPLTVGAFGAKGTGKTTWIVGRIRADNPPRLVTWDYKGDPLLRHLGREFFDLGDFIRAMKGPAFRLRFRPTHGALMHEQFAIFCRAVWIHGDLSMYVPELPEVTRANRAPEPWRTCVNVGREYTDREGRALHIAIYGDGQRQAECDKSFLNNLDVCHSGRMGHPADAKAVALKLGCDWRELMHLPDFHYIERRAGDMAPTYGTIAKNGTAKINLRAGGKPLGKVPKGADL
jgi:hypothetical protein